MMGGQRSLDIILNNIYPVGSIYLSVVSTNPSEYFGGVWERLSGGYIYAVTSDTATNSSYTGTGAQSHTLTINEIPAHSHGINFDQVWAFGGTTSIATTSGGPYGGSGYIQNTGGSQGHTHNVAYIGVFMWKRIS